MRPAVRIPPRSNTRKRKWGRCSTQTVPRCRTPKRVVFTRPHAPSSRPGPGAGQSPDMVLPQRGPPGARKREAREPRSGRPTGRASPENTRDEDSGAGCLLGGGGPGSSDRGGKLRQGRKEQERGAGGAVASWLQPWAAAAVDVGAGRGLRPREGSGNRVGIQLPAVTGH